jgi:putative aldouronate transport system permease protein
MQATLVQNTVVTKKKSKAKEINSISTASNIVLNVIFWIYTCLCLFPILLVLAVSFSDQKTVTLYGYNIIPKQFSIDAYKYLFADASQIVNAYGVSISVTLIDTILGLLMTALFAYPISRQDFSFRTFFSFFIFFQIVLPLSTPVLATIALFYTLGYWNDWFNSLIFIQKDQIVSLQYLMYKT